MSEPLETPEPRDQHRAVAWLLGRPGLVVALLWGLAEGSFFFLIPDIVLSLTALFSVKRSLLQMGLVVAGSLIAGSCLFAWSLSDYAAAKAAVLKVPFVREKMFDETSREFQRDGVGALFEGPTRGVPYKVYAVQAPAYCGLPAFLLASIPARLERLLISWIVFVCVGLGFDKFKARPRTRFLFHGAYWIAVYSYYWTVI